MYSKTGFTLLELAIVLVIIGLISAGILVGRDLIEGATLRSQISQIEKYRTAINTFRVKYGGLPGDLEADKADSFGLIDRTGLRGQGDGNGIIERCNPSLIDPSTKPLGCENILLWADLSKAGLIDGNFNQATNSELTSLTTDQIFTYFPKTKIPSGGELHMATSETTGVNWFTLQQWLRVDVSGYTPPNTKSDMTPAKAARIDSKLDDGNAISGNIILTSHGYAAPYGLYFYPLSNSASGCLNNDNYNLLNKDVTGCMINIRAGIN